MCSISTSAEWKEWMDQSDIIAFVEYGQNDEGVSVAKVIKCYKGALNKGAEIGLSGMYKPQKSGLENLFKSRYILCLSESQSDYFDVLASAPVVMNRVECNLFKYREHETLRTTSLKQFESFLEAYLDPTKRPEVCKKIVRKLHLVDDAEKATLWLMQLYILEYNQYHDVFQSCLIYSKNSTRYALLKLMGNIHSTESRRIIAAYLKSRDLWLVGLAIQALGNEPPETVGPLLLEQFKIWKEKGLKNDIHYNITAVKDEPKNEFGRIWDQVFGATYISNGDSRVLSEGYWEVIQALGKLQYKPAVPELLKFADECRRWDREEVLEVIKQIESGEYVNYLNGILESQNEELVSLAIKKILEDSLKECLPSLMNYISSIDRNANCNKSFIVSRTSGLGAFNDSITRNFLVVDFKKFENSRANFTCSNIEEWYLEYISSFKPHGEDCAHSVANEYLFNTYALNEDFGKYPSLFKIKKDLEEAAIARFQKILNENGYEWLSIVNAIAYIENTEEVILGKAPKVHYAILSDVIEKKSSWDKRDSAKIYAEILQNELGLSTDSIAIKIGGYIYSDYELPEYGWYYKGSDWRSISKSNFYDYTSYLLSCQKLSNEDFFQALLDYKYVIIKPERASIEQIISDLKEDRLSKERSRQ